MRSQGRAWKAAVAATVTVAASAIAAPAADAAPRQVEIFASPSGSGSACSQAEPCSLSSAIAKERAAEPTMRSDIVVYLHGGRYPVTNTITLDDRDSGRNGHRVIVRNYPDESPVLSGGQLITGWTLGSDGLWSANADGLSFFQLYGDDVRFTRARTDAALGQRWTIAGSRALKVQAPESILPGCQLDDLTGVQVRIMDTWRELRYPVTAADTGPSGTCFLSLRSPISTWNDWRNITGPGTGYGPNPIADKTAAFGPGGVAYLAGAKQFLDQNDEWYLDTTTDTVYLKSTTDPNTLHVTAPVTEQLLDISGASHVTVYGLQFAHSSWNGPLWHGNMQRQGGVHMTGTPSRILSTGFPVWYPNPAAVRVGSSSDILFQRNGFRYTGGNGMNLAGGTDDVKIIANVFTQISDTGLFVGTEQAPFAFDTPAKQNVNTIVKNNYFSWMGQTYATDSAITMNYPHGATIAHNTIENVHNIGINVGYFGVGLGTDTASVLQDVHVTDNRIDHACLTARDCGGWHSVGNYQHSDTVPRSTVTGNYITDVHANPDGAGARVQALYVDGGSNGLQVTNNEWSDVDHDMKVSRKAGNDLIINDNGRGDPFVIANAGLQPNFRDLATLDLQTTSIGGDVGPGIDTSSISLDAPSKLSADTIITVTATLVNHARHPINRVTVHLHAPDGFQLSPGDGTVPVHHLGRGQSAQASFQVVVPSDPPESYHLTATADYHESRTPRTVTDSDLVVTTPSTLAVQPDRTTFQPGESGEVTASLTNYSNPLDTVQLTMPAPAGWTVTAATDTSAQDVANGQTVQATWTVTAPAAGASTGRVRLTATAIWTAGAASGTVSGDTTVQYWVFPFEDDFDSDPVGTAPSDWTVRPGGGSVLVAADPGGSGQVMRIADDDPSPTGPTALITFPAQAEHVGYQVRLRAEQTTGGLLPILVDADGVSAVEVGFSGEGTIRTWGPHRRTSTDLMTYTPGTWYTITVDADVADGTFDVSINGSEMLSDAPINGQGQPISKLTFPARWDTGVYYVDSVGISH